MEEEEEKAFGMKYQSMDRELMMVNISGHQSARRDWKSEPLFSKARIEVGTFDFLRDRFSQVHDVRHVRVYLEEMLEHQTDELLKFNLPINTRVYWKQLCHDLCEVVHPHEIDPCR